MTLSSGMTLRQGDGAIPRPLGSVVTILITIWSLVVLVKGAELLRNVIVQSTTETPIPSLQVIMAAGTVGVCLVVGVLTRWLRPPLTLPLLAASSALLLLLASLITSSLLA